MSTWKEYEDWVDEQVVIFNIVHNNFSKRIGLIHKCRIKKLKKLR